MAASICRIRAAKTLEHLRSVMLVAGLRKGKRKTEKPSHVRWQGQQILVAAANPFERFRG